MQKIIDETMKLAKTHLLGFGFDEEQVTPLLVQAERDLRKELEKAEAIFSATPVDPEAVNKVLHALKGLLFTLGHEELGKKIEALREEDAETRDVSMIKVLLFGE